MTTEGIIDTWTRLTFGNDPKVVDVVNGLQANSWRVYEQYTGPLGIGGLTNIISIHYGPGIESAERNGWGQWFRADKHGIGMDRTVANGTGYIGQYPPQLAKVYESLDTCPDSLLLFMHHVPYNTCCTAARPWYSMSTTRTMRERPLRPRMHAMAGSAWACRRSALRRDSGALRIRGRPRGGMAGCGHRMVPEHLWHSR